MKHGIYYAYWEKEWQADYEAYIYKVKDLDFDILEIGAAGLPDYTQQEVKKLQDACEKTGVILTAGYGPRFEHNIGSADESIRKNALEWYKRLFDVMQALKIEILGGAVYSYWPVDFSTVNKQEDWKRSVEGMRILAPLAQKHNITLCTEVLNRFESHLLNTAKEGVAFVKEVACPNVKVMLDTFHMNIEEVSFSEAIREAGDLLGHFHTGECNRMVPGKGRTPWREVGEALREIGYDGAVVMEPFVNPGGQVGADIKVWRELNEDTSLQKLDADAKAAVAFQRYLLEA